MHVLDDLGFYVTVTTNKPKTQGHTATCKRREGDKVNLHNSFEVEEKYRTIKSICGAV